MARTMTDEEALALAPAVREFVDAVRDRDAELVQECMKYTPAGTLAILAADWVLELQSQVKTAQQGDREVIRALVLTRRRLAKALAERDDARAAQATQAQMIARLREQAEAA